MTLGENIVRLRTQKNWSQGDLADALDISRQSVSKWETDASIPELDKLLKLSELFGVTLDELVRGEEVPKTETAMPAAQTVPASFAPQATPEREKRRTIAGTVSLCTGAVILVFCLLLAGDPLAALLFGFFRALGNVYTGFAFLKVMNLPSSVYNMLPYIISLIVLAFTSKNSRAPKAEGIPYDKGQR